MISETKQIGLIAMHVIKLKLNTISYWVVVSWPILLLLASILFLQNTAGNNETIAINVLQDKALVTYINHSKLAKQTHAYAWNMTNKKAAFNQLHSEYVDYVIAPANKPTIFANQQSKSIGKLTTPQLLLSNYILNQSAHSKNKVPIDTHSISSKVAPSQIAQNVGIVVSFLIMVLAMSYAGIIATEISNEKSSRVMELLIVTTGAKNQYVGKILGVLGLVIINVFVLFVFAIGFFKFNGSIVPFSDAINQLLTPKFILLVFASIVIAMLSVLVITAEIASLINDQSQTQQALIPAMIWIGLGYVISLVMTGFFIQSDDLLLTARVLIGSVILLPGIGQMGIPEFVISGGINYVTATLILLIGLIGSLLLMKLSAKKYQANVLSYNRKDNILKQWLKTGF